MNQDRIIVKTLSPECWEELRDYLLYREKDIAWGIEDVGDLRHVFYEVFERKAKK